MLAVHVKGNSTPVDVYGSFIDPDFARRQRYELFNRVSIVANDAWRWKICGTVRVDPQPQLRCVGSQEIDVHVPA